MSAATTAQALPAPSPCPSWCPHPRQTWTEIQHAHDHDYAYKRCDKRIGVTGDNASGDAVTVSIAHFEDIVIGGREREAQDAVRVGGCNLTTKQARRLAELLTKAADVIERG